MNNNHNNHCNGKSNDAPTKTTTTTTTTTTSNRPLSWRSRVPPRTPPAPVAMNNVSLANLMMRSDHHHRDTLDLPEEEQLETNIRHLFIHPFFVTEQPLQQHRGETSWNVYHQGRFGIPTVAGAVPEVGVQQHQQALRESLWRMLQDSLDFVGDHSRIGGEEDFLLSEPDEEPEASMTLRRHQQPQLQGPQPQAQQEQQQGPRGVPLHRRQVVSAPPRAPLHPSSLMVFAPQPRMRGRFAAPATTSTRRGDGVPDDNGPNDARREFLDQ